jgi:hypothetical protein
MNAVENAMILGKTLRTLGTRWSSFLGLPEPYLVFGPISFLSLNSSNKMHVGVSRRACQPRVSCFDAIALSFYTSDCALYSIMTDDHIVLVREPINLVWRECKDGWGS